MPNWCYNSIVISGDSQKLKRVSAVIQVLKNSKDEDKKNNLFQSLIGLPPETDMEDYVNQGWYPTNINWFGTKWDVGLDFVQEVTKDQIILSGETAWSPPINFCIQLATQYGVKVEMYYEEPGCDFTGKCWVDEDGNHTEEDYTYSEGRYRFDGFNEWYECEFINNQCEYLAEELQDEDEPDFQGTIKDNFPFLTEEEVEECVSDLESEVVAMTGKEF